MLTFEDVYMMDQKRLNAEFSNSNPIHLRNRFTPMRDDSYLINRDPLTCVYCNPFDSVKSMKIDYSLHEITMILNDTVYSNTLLDNIRNDCLAKSYDPDVCIRDVDDLCLCYQSLQYADSNTDRLGGLPLSLIYNDGSSKKYYYGNVLIFGKGMVSLPRPLQWYVLSNTYRIYNNEFGYTIATILYKDSIKKILKETECDSNVHD